MHAPRSDADIAHSDANTRHEDANRVHEDHESRERRMLADAPTREYVVGHTSPCAPLASFRSIVCTCSGGALLVAATVAWNIWQRQDHAGDRATAAEIAAASLTTEVRVELVAIKAGQARQEAAMARIEDGLKMLYLPARPHTASPP